MTFNKICTLFNHIDNYNFFNLKITSFNIEDLLKYFEYVIENNKQIIAYGYSLGNITLFDQHPEIFIFGNKADVLVSDGRLFYLLLKVLKFPIKDELSIPNMVRILLKLAEKLNYSVMLLGADDKTNTMATNKIRSKFKNIKVFNGINGYFEKNEENNIINRINENSPDILLIGMSSPKKERLAYEWKSRLNVSVIIPCGGMIDVLALKTTQTPPIIKKYGLASFYRLVQEPKRLWRRYLYMYSFFIFRFLPSFITKVIILKKEYSIPNFYGIK